MRNKTLVAIVVILTATLVWAQSGEQATSSAPTQNTAAQTVDRQFSPIDSVVTPGEGSRVRRSTMQVGLQGAGIATKSASDDAQMGATVAGTAELDLFLGQGASLRYYGNESYRSNTYTDTGRYGAHGLTFIQQWNMRQWQVQFAESAQYSSGSTFGYGGLQGLTGLAGPLSNLPDPTRPNLNPVLTPEQTILTSDAGSLSNTAALEATYRFNRRKSFTATSSVGVFRAVDSDLLEGMQYSFGGSYQYALSRATNIALNYSYTQHTIDTFDRDVVSHAAGVSVSRQLSRNVDLQLGAAAQPYTIRQQGVESDELTWAANAGLNWAISRNQLSLAFSRSIGLGSGILAGAQVTSLRGALTRHLREWDVSLSSGFARNEELGTSRNYDSAYGGVGVSRRLFSTVNAFLNYNVQHQVITGTCARGTCSVPDWAHTIGFGISWNSKPIAVGR